jgi:hypothetical protein
LLELKLPEAADTFTVPVPANRTPDSTIAADSKTLIPFLNKFPFLLIVYSPLNVVLTQSLPKTKMQT